MVEKASNVKRIIDQGWLHKEKVRGRNKASSYAWLYTIDNMKLKLDMIIKCDDYFHSRTKLNKMSYWLKKERKKVGLEWASKLHLK